MENIINFDELVSDYITNEIEYIEQCMAEDKKNIDDYKKDLKRLNFIDSSEEVISNIACKVMNDNELKEKIDELVHFYLYH